MYHSSPRIHFDTMFVILCVIAGANSHIISSTHKLSSQPLGSHFQTSFMDLILDADLIEFTQGSNSINEESTVTQSATNHRGAQATSDQRAHTICSILSHQLPSNHMKFCLKHQDILEAVLPEVTTIATRECARITSDLKWNCSKIDHLLDRSNPLAYTREAAFVRSIINASMMFLVARYCGEHGHGRSCGCQSDPTYKSETIELRQTRHINTRGDDPKEVTESGTRSDLERLFNLQDLSSSDLDRLKLGLPLRLVKPIIHRQDCQATIAFADAFTKVFMDSDDTKSITKAYQVLNQNRHRNKRRQQDSDYKDLAYIKWTKSVINLHNNNVGRKIVREETQKRCRCHGLSGVCQFQTCWEQLMDFKTIATRLRFAYLSDAARVEVRNLGTYDRPDLHLMRYSSPSTSGLEGTFSEEEQLTQAQMGPRISRSNPLDETEKAYQFGPGDIIYLYDSPNYCEPQPDINHPGTRGRTCKLSNNLTQIRTSKKPVREVDSIEVEGDHEGLGLAHGTCESLCCNRGYHSELILDMVTCNCRFRFCCRVECDRCLKQRQQHYCL